MGFYLRKSISVGPLRFNFSKSGIGISAGVKGFRYGIGPRGNYVHMGRGGLYYRVTLPSSEGHNNSSSQSKVSSPPQLPPETHAPLEEIESADISRMVNSSSRELLDELNKKRLKMRLLPVVVITSAVIIVLGLLSNWPNWLLILLIITGAIGIFLGHTYDALNKTAVLFYDFDSDLEAIYIQLHNATKQLSSCAVAWHIEASGKVYDRKYHAGANELVRRKRTFIQKAEPPYLKTNIETIAVGVGRQTLYFFPDRVLIYDKSGVGAVSYSELCVEVNATRFIESDSVPYDAEVVGHTWKYVNKSGGPDRRFKDNKELPICRYEEILLSSQSGLNEAIHLSRCGLGREFAEAISSVGKNMPKEGIGIAQ